MQIGQIISKLKQSAQILRYTGYRHYRPKQLHGRVIEYYFNATKANVQGLSVWSMIKEIMICDSYHLKSQANPSVIFDIGANVGIFSLHAATMFPNCRIFAFEPSADNFKVLTENTKPFPNIHCFQMAISCYDGIGFLSGNDNTAYKVSAAVKDEQSESCVITTVGSFINQNKIQNIDLMKLDCEGAEYDIATTDLKSVAQIVGEYHVMDNKNPIELQTRLLDQNFYIKEWREFEERKNGDDYNSGIFWAIRK